MDESEIELTALERQTMRQKLIAWMRANRLLTFILCYVIVYFVVGLTFYSIVEGWSFTDIIYFTTIIISSVGYGDLTPTSTGSKWFTVFYALSGVGLFTFILAIQARHTTSNTIEQEYRHRLESSVEAIRHPHRRRRRSNSSSTSFCDESHQSEASSEASDASDSRVSRRVKRGLVAFAVLFSLIAVGTMFASFELELDFTDSVYWATITGTSIGFGDIVPSRRKDGSDFEGGKWFATFYIIAFFMFMLKSLSWASQYLSSMMRQQNVKAALRMKLSAELVASMDVDGDGGVDRSEFLAALLVANNIAPAKVVKAVLDRFDQLDQDNDGKLTTDDIITALSPRISPVPATDIEHLPAVAEKPSRTNSAVSQSIQHTPPASDRSEQRGNGRIAVTKKPSNGRKASGKSVGTNTSSEEVTGFPSDMSRSDSGQLSQVIVSAPL